MHIHLFDNNKKECLYSGFKIEDGELFLQENGVWKCVQDDRYKICLHDQEIGLVDKYNQPVSSYDVFKLEHGYFLIIKNCEGYVWKNGENSIRKLAWDKNYIDNSLVEVAGSNPIFTDKIDIPNLAGVRDTSVACCFNRDIITVDYEASYDYESAGAGTLIIQKNGEEIYNKSYIFQDTTRYERELGIPLECRYGALTWRLGEAMKFSREIQEAVQLCLNQVLVFYTMYKE